MQVTKTNFNRTPNCQLSFQMHLISVPSQDKWQFETLKRAISKMRPNIDVILTYGCESGCWAYKLSGGGKFYEHAASNIDAEILHKMAYELAKLISKH